jgi:hypothetical protein
MAGIETRPFSGSTEAGPSYPSAVILNGSLTGGCGNEMLDFHK